MYYWKVVADGPHGKVNYLGRVQYVVWSCVPETIEDHVNWAAIIPEAEGGGTL